MLLHVARVWAGSFAVFVFLHSATLEFGRGHTIKQLPRGSGFTRPLHAHENQTKFTNHDESLKPALVNKSRF